MEVLIVFGSITAIIISIVSFRHKEHLTMIEKGMNPYKNKYPKSGGLLLFLGLTIFAIGMAFICVYFINERHMLMPAMLHLFIGAAMLIYWKITETDRQKARQLYEEEVRETKEVQ